MIPSHLTPDSGVIDCDLCQRRQRCQRENMCVSSHQPSFCLCGGHRGWYNKKILEYNAANPPDQQHETQIYTFVILKSKCLISQFLCCTCCTPARAKNKYIKPSRLDDNRQQKRPRSAINHSQMSAATISPPPTKIHQQ